MTTLVPKCEHKYVAGGVVHECGVYLPVEHDDHECMGGHLMDTPCKFQWPESVCTSCG